VIVVTGGAGFIGSNLVHALCARGRTDVVVVDRMNDPRKVKNLATARIADFLDKKDFLTRIVHPHASDSRLHGLEAVFHLGACSDTTEIDGRFLLRNNYEYSRAVLDFCQHRAIPLVYASSASVYGTGTAFREANEHEAPMHAYGYSKWLFDERVRRVSTATAPIIGLRYFNVYGPREEHKDTMASMVYQLHRQLEDTQRVRLFRGTDGCADGEQRRDFVHVDDVVHVNLWFLEHARTTGIYNVGTGTSRSFNDVARAVIGFHRRGSIEYIDVPAALRGRYQSRTQADLSSLRALGCPVEFTPLEEGVRDYLTKLGTRAGST